MKNKVISIILVVMSVALLQMSVEGVADAMAKACAGCTDGTQVCCSGSNCKSSSGQCSCHKTIAFVFRFVEVKACGVSEGV